MRLKHHRHRSIWIRQKILRKKRIIKDGRSKNNLVDICHRNLYWVVYDLAIHNLTTIRMQKLSTHVG
jgi:hypothetical protein